MPEDELVTLLPPLLAENDPKRENVIIPFQTITTSSSIENLKVES